MFYERNLPHWQPDLAEFFVTFRLANSLPKAVIERIKTQKRIFDQKLTNSSEKLSELHKYRQAIFQRYEQQLDRAKSGLTWLANAGIAQIVKQAIHFRDSNVYDLYAYCIMPNHVHIVLKMFKENIEDQTPALTKMLQNLKSYTALQCNRLLNRKSSFWQSESFDRVIRNQKELESTIRYVLQNPVKANLVDNWWNWPYSFCKSEFKNDFK